jgi:predicted nucleic acid-binding protein
VRLLIDTGILGGICHPRKHADIRAWFARAVREHELLVSVVCDYELRRELLRIRSARYLRRLDELTRELPFIDLSVAIASI